ncbi:MAG: c-type cytochrome [Bacteroidota bacterium]
MKKTFVAILAFLALIAVSFAFTNAGEDPLYKNLKILPKNITKVQLDSVMNHFTASLGVKCGFCHVRNEAAKAWNFPADSNKHKLVAREMMKLTYKINEKYFDVTGSKNLNATLMVTCYTCHNGKKEPLSIAPKPADQPRPPQGEPAKTK